MKIFNPPMKSLLLAGVLAAVPMLSQAAATFVGDTASVTFNFASVSDLSISYSWDDLIYQKKNGGSQTADGSLSYILDGAYTPVTVGSLGATGSGTLSFSDLAAGSHTLSLRGLWTVPNGGTVSQYGDVSLGAATITAAVPEPDKFAMLLAGLGMMGAVIRRRTRQD